MTNNDITRILGSALGHIAADRSTAQRFHVAGEFEITMWQNDEGAWEVSWVAFGTTLATETLPDRAAAYSLIDRVLTEANRRKWNVTTVAALLQSRPGVTLEDIARTTGWSLTDLVKLRTAMRVSEEEDEARVELPQVQEDSLAFAQ